jgi:small subunit ribosomal protein S3
MGSLNLKLNVYLNTLSFIFKYLRKRAHVRYYSLLKKTFQIVIKSPRTKIKGVRFLIKGRLKGKTRASTHTIQIGRVPRQSFSANVEYAESTAFTSNCGTFGFRMWVYKIS